jgi:hypothetical protein
MDNEIMVYIPELKEFLRAAEGTGDNLLKEDRDAGYVDYVYISIFRYSDGEFYEEDGGEMMLKELFTEHYKDIKDVLSDAMKFIYEKEFEYIIIENNDEL